MLATRTFIFLALGLALVRSTAISVYVTPKGIEALKKRLVLDLTRKLQGLKVPDNSLPERPLESSNLQINTLTMTHENLKLQISGQKLALTLEGVDANLEADFNQSVLGMDFHGRAFSVAKGMSLKLSLRLGFNPTIKRLQVELIDQDLDLNFEDLKVEAGKTQQNKGGHLSLTNIALSFKDSVISTARKDGKKGIRTQFIESIAPNVQDIPLSLDLSGFLGVPKLHVDFSPCGNDGLRFVSNGALFQTDFMVKTGPMDDGLYRQKYHIPGIFRDAPKGETYDHVLIDISDRMLIPLLEPFFDAKERTRIEIGLNPTPFYLQDVLSASVFVRGKMVHQIDLKFLEEKMAKFGEPRLSIEMEQPPSITFEDEQVRVEATVRVSGTLDYTALVKGRKGDKDKKKVLVLEDEGFKVSLAFGVEAVSDYKTSIQDTPEQGVYKDRKVEGISVRFANKPSHSSVKLRLTPTDFKLQAAKWRPERSFQATPGDTLARFVGIAWEYLANTMDPIEIPLPLDALPPLVFLKHMRVTLTEGWMMLSLILDYQLDQIIDSIFEMAPETVDLQTAGQKGSGFRRKNFP